jgi:hypothetical protein
MSESNGKHGKELDATFAQLPALMAELTREFIENRDLNARVQIRMRMRAILDLAFVDTIWPTNSVKKPAAGSAREAAMADPVVGDGMAAQMNQQNPAIYAPATVQAVPGAERADDNTI